MYLARADLFPDALAAGSLTDGPILLVNTCDPVPQSVKDEIAHSRQSGVSGLMFTYPAHQAADILFCKANLVPVGSDQLPHLVCLVEHVEPTHSGVPGVRTQQGCQHPHRSGLPSPVRTQQPGHARCQLKTDVPDGLAGRTVRPAQPGDRQQSRDTQIRPAFASRAVVVFPGRQPWRRDQHLPLHRGYRSVPDSGRPARGLSSIQPTARLAPHLEEALESGLAEPMLNSVSASVSR